MREIRLTQLGRSMVEMLGVLAVIGVLSIVGIAGYKKAMNRIYANDLLSVGMKAYHAAIAKAALNGPTKQADANFTAIPNLDIEKLSWKPNANIRVVLWNLGDKRYNEQTYHVIYFLNLGNSENDCNVCDAVKDITLPKGTSKSIRLLPRSQTDTLSEGIWIGCHWGGYSDATSCWK